MTQPETAARTPSVQLTRAKSTHVKDARRLLDEYYREVGVLHRDTARGLRRLVGHADFGFWIVYMGGTPAGCVALRPLPRIPAAGECKRLFVRAEFRRRGLADKLLDGLEESARGRGLAWMYLDSKDDLDAAIALYRRRGYEPCPRYNDNEQATLFLRKRLTDS